MKPIFTLLFLFLCGIGLYATPHSPFAAPTSPATNFSITSNDGDRLGLSWTNGNGARRLVIARKGQAVTAVPVNGVDYNASNQFGNGNEIAPGEFVVYNSTGNTMTVLNLQVASSYHFAIFEYNGTGSGIAYLATATVKSGATLSAPQSQPTNLSVTNVTGHSMKVNWTNPPALQAGSGRLVIAREGAPVNVNPTDLVNYNANGIFGSGTEIGTGNYVVFKGNSTSASIDALKPNTTYHFAVFEYSGNTGLVFNINNPPVISAATLPRPVTAASAPVFTNIEGSFLKFSWTPGSGDRRMVVASASGPVTALPVDGTGYTANSIFGSGQQLAPGQFVVYNGTGDNFLMTSLSIGTTYHFAVFEYDGAGATAAYLTSSFLAASQATVSAPTQAASNPVFSNLTNSSFTLSWTPGNGARRLVLVKSGSAVNTAPVNLTQYSASSNFGSGTQLGSGNYTVYTGTANSVTVNQLTAGVTYHIAVFEYNGSSAPVYIGSSATGSVTTSQAPTQAAHSLQFQNVEGNRLTLAWSNGNGARRIVIARQGAPVTSVPVDGLNYTANTAFGAGQELNPGEFVVYNNTASSFTLTNLNAGTTYHFAIFEFNTVNAQTFYLTSTFATGNQSTSSAPVTNSSAMVFSNVAGNSMRLSWTKGSGANRIVVAKAGAPVDALPTDFTSYSASSIFGNGAELGTGNFVIYAGNANAMTVTGLSNSTTYHFAVFEYNGSNFPVYLRTGALAASQQTADRPTLAASAMYFLGVEGNRQTVRWTNGNGTRRLVIARTGQPVSFRPTDGVEYTANASFGSGMQVAPGEFVVYNNNGGEVGVSNLQINTTYHYAVFEYDGTGAATRYLTSPFASGSQVTLSAPLQGASNVLFSSIGSGSVNINWTNGDGDRHLVIVRKAQPVTAVPVQLQVYNTSTSFGSASSVISGDQYAVFNGSASNVTITNLQPGTTYHVAVFAFNGFLGPVYNTTHVATSQITTLGPPSDAATNVVFGNTGNQTTLQINWTNGSGQRRLVLVKQGAAVDEVPVNQVSYTANTFFGSGQQLGNGNFVVYNGTGSSVTISNLSPGLSYHVAVFEYNQFAAGPNYLTTNPARNEFNGFPLPVRLTGFSGRREGQTNVLQWKTATEVNSRHFVVQRSANGNVFMDIGIVAASGNSQHEQRYQFVDAIPPATGYYRLQMVDADGKIAYSPVVRLEATATTAGMEVYPTLASATVHIRLTCATRQAAVVELFDAGGRLMRQSRQALDAGVNVWPIEVSRLMKGSYVLRVQVADRVYTNRFVKE